MNERKNTAYFPGKVEFWAATTVFVFSMLFLNSDDMNPYWADFEVNAIPFDYYRNFIFPSLVQYAALYGAFLVLNFKVVPAVIHRQKIPLHVLYGGVTFIALGLVLGITETYLKKYLLYTMFSEDEAHDLLLQNGFARAFNYMLLFLVYSGLKYYAVALVNQHAAGRTLYHELWKEASAAFLVVVAGLLLLTVLHADYEIRIGLGLAGFSGILFYTLSFVYFIPWALARNRPFVSYAAGAGALLLLCIFLLGLVVMIFTPGNEEAYGISALNSFFHFFVTMPLAWQRYKRREKDLLEVTELKHELGQTSANLDFLRSQINPHFLFNALNTLYGTALQENGERTAQGIQMLGDMMRFMLHENNQQKILLSREVEYMRNYLELQMLRISSSPNIEIKTTLADVLDEKFIAPMLLIPFVENAFKHGISLQNKSWIKIALHTEQNKLYFDVYNSVQSKSELDPEKEHSGIGLQNVKQRLALLYPGRHELIIRHTQEEYFVHLTLQL